MNFPIDQSSTNAEKIALFRTLFVGREDVFARRYENERRGQAVIRRVVGISGARDVC